jgi:hypothetical protein
MTRMLPRLAVFLAVVLVLCGCRHLDREYADSVDYLVGRKATKADAIREFGQPINSTVDGNRETVVFIPFAKTSRKSVTKVVNGVATTEDTAVGKPGKFKVTMVFISGVATGGTVSLSR